MRGIISIIIGGILVFEGLRGTHVLRGTHSGTGLAVVGGVIILIGILRIAKG